MKLKWTYLSILAIVVIVIGGAVLAGFGLYGSAITEDVSQEVNRTAETKATQLDSVLSERVRTVQLQAADPVILESGERRSEALRRFLNTTSFEGISVIAANGTMLAIQANGLSQTRQAEIVGSDFSDRRYFQQALTGEPYVSDPVAAETGNYIVTMSLPIERDSEIVGTINAALHLEKEGQFFTPIQPTANGTELQVTAGDTVLYESDNFDRANAIVGRTPMQETNWTVAVAQPENAATAGVRQALYMQAGAGLLVFLTLGAFGVWLYRSTIQQITELLWGFNRISDQQYDTKIELAGAEEWEVIEQRFNETSTELAQYQQEQKERTERLNLALEGANLGLWDWDIEASEVYRDNRWAEMLGYDPEEIDKEFESWQKLVHPADRKSQAEALAAHIDGEENFYSGEYRLRTKSGEWKWIRNTGKIVEWDGSTPKRAVGVHLDIDDQKRTRQRLKRNNELLQAIDRVLRHNINNEMNVIRGYTETIAEATEGSLSTRAEKILESSDNLLATIDKERQITRLINELEPPTTVEVGPLLRRLAATLRDEYPEATIDVIGEQDSAISAVPAAVDAIEELVDNAIVHAQRPDPRVEIGIQQHTEFVDITVTDNGPGLPEMERNILTKSEDITPLYHGSGLGLWFVKIVADRSDAEVTVAETHQSGTVITMKFPRVEAAPDTDPDTSAPGA